MKRQVIWERLDATQANWHRRSYGEEWIDLDTLTTTIEGLIIDLLEEYIGESRAIGYSVDGVADLRDLLRSQ